MHVRARPPAAALYGALLAHTLVSAGNYLFAKRALMEIPALPLGLGALLVPSYRADIVRASTAAWWGVAYLILMTSVVAYLLWYWALAHLAAARVAIFTNLQPLATALLGQLFLGERMTAPFFGAAAVVIAGVLLAQWRAADAAEEALLESPAKP